MGSGDFVSEQIDFSGKHHASVRISRVHPVSLLIYNTYINQWSNTPVDAPCAPPYSARLVTSSGFKHQNRAVGDLPVAMGPVRPLLLCLLASAAAQVTVTPTVSPSKAGVCHGNNVQFQINERPQFDALVSTTQYGISDDIEIRLCIGSSTTIANVGVLSLTLSVSPDGKQHSPSPLPPMIALSLVFSPHLSSLFLNPPVFS